MDTTWAKRGSVDVKGIKNTNPRLPIELQVNLKSQQFSVMLSCFMLTPSFPSLLLFLLLAEEGWDVRLMNIAHNEKSTLFCLFACSCSL